MAKSEKENQASLEQENEITGLTITIDVLPDDPGNSKSGGSDDAILTILPSLLIENGEFQYFDVRSFLL